MPRRSLLLALAVLALVASACGGDNLDLCDGCATRTATPGPTESPTPTCTAGGSCATPIPTPSPIPT